MALAARAPMMAQNMTRRLQNIQLSTCVYSDWYWDWLDWRRVDLFPGLAINSDEVSEHTKIGFRL